MTQNPTALWRAGQPLVLASRSSARHAVLTDAGIPVEVLPADIDERAVEASADRRSPGEIAGLLARAKALTVASLLLGRLVLGADQTLSLGTRLFTKPETPAAAREQLKALRGRTHELHSAIALARDGAVLFEHCAIARLSMRDFSDDFLDAYLQSAGPAVTASVGAYQMEGLGIQLFDRIEGDHFTILGLPLLTLLQELRRRHHVGD